MVGLTPILSGLALALLATLYGCDDRNAGPAAKGAISEEVATWQLEQLASIGMAQGERPYLLSRVISAVPSGNGYIVADGSSNELRLFDENGIHVRTVGGRGSGPGEFEALRWMGLVADSIYAWDLRARRVTVFDLELNLVRTGPLHLPTTYVMVGVFPDGQLLVWPFGPTSRTVNSAQIVQDSSTFAVTHIGAENMTHVVSVPAQPSFMWPNGSLMRVPFTAEASVAVSGDRIWAGNGSSGMLSRFSRTGVEEVTIRVGQPHPVSSEDVASFRAGQLEELSGPSLTERTRMLDELPLPAEHPAYDRVRAGASGEVWVRLYAAGERRVHAWQLLDEGGSARACVELPPTADILYAEADRLILNVRDDLGVEQVQVHRFVK